MDFKAMRKITVSGVLGPMSPESCNIYIGPFIGLTKKGFNRGQKVGETEQLVSRG